MNASSQPVRLAIRIYAVVVGIVGLCLLTGGLYLITLGGSWYYALAGGALAWSGWRCFKGDIMGIWIYLGVFALTLIWALIEVGFTFWPQVPRLVAPLFLAAWAMFLVPLFPPQKNSFKGNFPFHIAGGVLAACFIAFMAGMFFPHDIVRKDFNVVPGQVSAPTMAMGGDWTSYGRTGEGTRYAPLDQINRDNVDKLEMVWQVQHGDIADDKVGKEDQNTPIFAGGKLFQCSPSSRVTAIDPSTGTIIWQYDPKTTAPYWQRCRGLGFVPAVPGANVSAVTEVQPESQDQPLPQDQQAAQGQPQAVGTTPPQQANNGCSDRVVVATVDGRLISLKADDGTPCESFGTGGTVQLSEGLGPYDPGIMMPTTGPNVAGDKIVIGAWISDNVSEGEPSGVIRAFDAYSGALDWAWDLGNPAVTKLPPEGQTYTLGTPNVWPPMAWDLELGTVYLPMGNATPDFFGGNRRPFDDEYSSSVVALDLNTGRPKWKYQTVHHDLWDYDLPAQPALYDMPDGNGGTIPALIQLTKRGQIFVLDRRTGQPITPVEERPAPKSDGTATGEYYSATQPYSVGMPVVAGDPLKESSMWGATPIDQMLCRIKFRKYRYDGDFTVPSTKRSIEWPGNGGGLNWGSASVDQERNILVVNDVRLPIFTELLKLDQVPPGTEFKPHGGWAKQLGTPWALHMGSFFSPIGFPCVSPPMGMITGIDLASRKVVWQIPAGTMGDLLGVPIYVGMPTMGGPMTTKGGIAFFAGTQDFYLRAMDVETGKELWKGRLPVGAQATPMTFFDQKTGRQMIVVSVGGARDNSKARGDYIVAFALPPDGS